MAGESLRASYCDPEGCALLRPGEPPQVHVRRSGPHQAGPTGQVSAQTHNTKLILCPFAEHYLRYAVTSFFTISRISLADGKRAGQKVHRKIAVAVQNVKPLYFLSRSFEIREKYCQQSFFLSIVIQLTISKETGGRRVSRGRD